MPPNPWGCVTWPHAETSPREPWKCIPPNWSDWELPEESWPRTGVMGDEKGAGPPQIAA